MSAISVGVNRGSLSIPISSCDRCARGRSNLESCDCGSYPSKCHQADQAEDRTGLLELNAKSLDGLHLHQFTINDSNDFNGVWRPAP